TGPQSIHILRGVRQQQDEPGRFSICSRQAAVVHQNCDYVNATMFDRYLPFSCPLNTFVTDAVRFAPFHHH
ncbi:hypothetical protein ACRW0Y_23995, partial [Escherichia coli]